MIMEFVILSNINNVLQNLITRREGLDKIDKLHVELMCENNGISFEQFYSLYKKAKKAQTVTILIQALNKANKEIAKCTVFVFPVQKA